MISIISLLDDESRASELWSAEGELGKDINKILAELGVSPGTDRMFDRIKVGDDKQTLHITLEGVVHVIKLSRPIKSRSLGVIERHWYQMGAGRGSFHPNGLSWRYSTP